MRQIITILITLLVTYLPLVAQFGPSDGESRSTSSLLVDHESIAPGATFTAALHLYHPEGWHSYYRNTGGVELPPGIQWELPEGFEVGPIQWPVPSVKQTELGTSFIYEGGVTLLVDITAPPTLSAGESVTLKANAAWQICEVSCISEEARFELTLPVSEQAVLDQGNELFFQQARSKLPRSLEGWTVEAKEQDKSVLLRFTAGSSFEATPTDFIPDQAYLKAASVNGSIERKGDEILVTLERATVDIFDEPIEQGNVLSGILIGDGQTALVPPTPIASPTPLKASPEAVSFSAFLPILGGMFLGGLILNLMPCVFPVIGLKIMGFVQQAGEDRKKVILHGVIFSIGVILSFAVLSTILFLFKESFGWGDQLGKPWFVLPMMILIFLLGLNMYGVFEIGASATSIGGNLQAKEGYSGSFFSGALATLIATPCSAPFLGTAIGTAIGLPAFQFFTAFGAMALGLSAPYLILSAFPRLIESLPRPGAWMESFKQAMSFLLFGTAGFLLWVYTDLVDMQQMTWPYPVFGLTLIAVAAWIHGRWNLPSRTKRARVTAMAFIAIFACGGFLLAMPPATPAPSESSKPTLTWETWSPEKVEKLLEEGTPVYIDFTAKWCATCNVNKGRAYPERVVERMQELGVVALKADKTKPNPQIETAIRTYGRAAIPVNVLLIPGNDPIVLPELLGPGDVLEALKVVEGP